MAAPPTCFTSGSRWPTSAQLKPNTASTAIIMLISVGTCPESTKYPTTPNSTRCTGRGMIPMRISMRFHQERGQLNRLLIPPPKVLLARLSGLTETNLNRTWRLGPVFMFVSGPEFMLRTSAGGLYRAGVGDPRYGGGENLCPGAFGPVHGATPGAAECDFSRYTPGRSRCLHHVCRLLSGADRQSRRPGCRPGFRAMPPCLHPHPECEFQVRVPGAPLQGARAIPSRPRWLLLRLMNQLLPHESDVLPQLIELV